MLTILVQILSNKCASRKRVASTRAVRAKTEAACLRLSDTGAPGRSRKEAQRMAPGGLQCRPPGSTMSMLKRLRRGACAF
jgi:hypothetical protein